ncbi:MAG TPA: M1 family peptidase, partial [Myxococcales bacterium]|nr:M1 family peptidase [Myxococcales bacterium]
MRLDPHSYTDSGQPQTRDIDLALRADFQNRMLEGEITLRFREPGGGAIDLDSRELRIDAVAALDGALLRYELAAAEPILGARLRVTLPAGARGLRIRYRTSPTASALQWLEPSQTAGKEPFLFSQCQPIHARSLAPLQDTPRIRITVGRARFKVPSRLRTLMAAAAKGREDAGGSEAVDLFEMPQPIPPYLLAFAVGDLERRELSARAAVWSERAVVDAAAYEFAEAEEMIRAAE